MRRIWRILLAGGLTGVVLAAAGALLWGIRAEPGRPGTSSASAVPSARPVPPSMPGGPPPGAPVLIGGTAAPSESSGRGAEVPPVPGQPLRVQLPDVGLDVRVYASRLPQDRTLDPPTVQDAFWVMDFGTAGPASRNTLYIAAHSSSEVPAAFNPLLDKSAAGGAVHVGQKILVTAPEGSYSYTVTGSARYAKTDILGAGKLWEAVPGRLVLVTCFQYDYRAASDQNFVVYAQLDTGNTHG
ncbi:class F sortase [Arthrobacter sp. NPDC090010]|uniref:class F sortase n=1 Tax=Arthrobacter sp. NPDC090010 TaxID=3363942 RepID=UPI0038046FB3